MSNFVTTHRFESNRHCNLLKCWTYGRPPFGFVSFITFFTCLVVRGKTDILQFLFELHVNKEPHYTYFIENRIRSVTFIFGFVCSNLFMEITHTDGQIRVPKVC